MVEIGQPASVILSDFSDRSFPFCPTCRKILDVTFSDKVIGEMTIKCRPNCNYEKRVTIVEYLQKFNNFMSYTKAKCNKKYVNCLDNYNNVYCHRCGWLCNECYKKTKINEDEKNSTVLGSIISCCPCTSRTRCRHYPKYENECALHNTKMKFYCKICKENLCYLCSTIPHMHQEYKDKNDREPNFISLEQVINKIPNNPFGNDINLYQDIDSNSGEDSSICANKNYDILMENILKKKIEKTENYLKEFDENYINRLTEKFRGQDLNLINKLKEAFAHFRTRNQTVINYYKLLLDYSTQKNYFIFQQLISNTKYELKKCNDNNNIQKLIEYFDNSYIHVKNDDILQ